MTMRTLVACAALTGMALASDVSGQPHKPAAAASGSEHQLMQMERDILDAVKKKDAAKLASMLAEDFTLVTPGGELMDKAASVGAVKDGEYVLRSLDLSEMKVRVYGETAIVTYIGDEKSSYQGRDVSGKSRTTDVFVRRAGAWQQVAAHSTSLAQPKP